MTKRTNSSVPELLRKVEFILRKKDPLPKTVTEACHELFKWKIYMGANTTTRV